MTDATAAMKATLTRGTAKTAAQVQHLQVIRASIPKNVSITPPSFGFVNW